MVGVELEMPMVSLFVADARLHAADYIDVRTPLLERHLAVVPLALAQ